MTTPPIDSRARLMAASLTALAAALLAPAAALAQDAAPTTEAEAPAIDAAVDDADESEGQAIVVTGTRLSASGFTAPTPVTVLGTVDIER